MFENKNVLPVNTLFAPVQILHKLREQQDDNNGDLHSSLMGEVGWGSASNFISVPQYVIVVGLHFKQYTCNFQWNS